MHSAHRCLVWAAGGGALGLALVARAQDPVAVAPAADPGSLSLLVDLIQGGGLPAVLALFGWLAGRGGVPVVIRLSDEDRRLLRRLRPQPPKPDDDSDHPPTGS